MRSRSMMNFAGQQFAGFRLADLGDGAGDLLVDAALRAVEFLLAGASTAMDAMLEEFSESRAG